MTTTIRYFLLLLPGAVAASVCYWATSIPIPPSPRFGHRGVARAEAMQTLPIFAAAEPLLRFIAGILAQFPLNSQRARRDRELRRAGHFLGLTPDEFVALSLLSAMVSGSFFLMLNSFGYVQQSLWPAAAVLGYFLPALQAHGIVRQREKVISRALPQCIEIAALCMSAGLDFPTSLRLLVKASRDRSDALVQELEAILEEIDLGHTRQHALSNFAQRVRSPAVRDFVSAVVQSEQKGTPLVKVIQVQGRVLNLRRSVAAEEAAARAGVLMIGPLVLLLASILLLLMGPFLIKGIGF